MHGIVASELYPHLHVTALVKVSPTTILPQIVAYGFARVLNGPPICKIYCCILASMIHINSVFYAN